MFLRPYLQCWRCENPLGCLQSILRLYLSDHLCLRVRVLFDIFVYILDIYNIYTYIIKFVEKKSGFIATQEVPLNYLGIQGCGFGDSGFWEVWLVTHEIHSSRGSVVCCGRLCLCVGTE
jgi:hypothetical protein